MKDYQKNMQNLMFAFRMLNILMENGIVFRMANNMDMLMDSVIHR